MISHDTIQKLAVQYRTHELNIIREYFQHLFLSSFYKLEESEKILFKGGTALRIIYGSPRFSEDLDFSIFSVSPIEQKTFIEHLFTTALSEIEKIGIQVKLGSKPGKTTEGYYGEAILKIYDYAPMMVVINISGRDIRYIPGEIVTIPNDFIPTYNLFHLPQTYLVEEKIFDALLNRKKARDFYDLYFILRKGLFTSEQKRKLRELQSVIISLAGKIDFRTELSVFLPQDHQLLLKNFPKTLVQEFQRQLG